MVVLNAPHEGTLLSGQITCTCGFTTKRAAVASDVFEEFDEHLAAQAVTEPPTVTSS